MIGRTISHYRVEEQLGRGGMGIVYRAFDERLRRPVALKLLREDIAGQGERRAQVLREARAASALNHPGITTIYEVGEQGEQLFIVMELVSGKTLRAVAGERPLETRALIRLGADAAEALGAAHAQGIIHGDFKPENIVVRPDGRVKLLDFGIARPLMVDTAGITRTEPVPTCPIDPHTAGTLAYMAPEQLKGAPTDARADLFAFGAVLYELAAGRRPFPGPTMPALVAQIVNEAPAPLAASAREIPPELARIVHKLLEKSPESRYQSAREVQVDLANLARDLDLGAILPPAVAGKRAVAVLPFKLLTPNPDDEYLTVALADSVINDLSAVGDALVRPTSTVMRYVKHPVDPLLAARELNVQFIVDGSIQKFGPRLRVHVQAWNAADGSTVFSAKHDAEVASLLELQDKMTEGLARALGARAPAGRAATPPTLNSTAYELFLRAGDRMSRGSRWDTRTAIEMLEGVIRLDSRFADAWARLAEARLTMAVGFEPGGPWFRRAEQALRRALALDSDNVEAQIGRGRLLWTPAKGFQNRLALRTLSKVLRLSPDSHQGHFWRGLIFLHVGLHEDAHEDLAAALATNPDDPYTLNVVGQTALFRNLYDEAEDYNDRALRMDSAHLWANIFAPTAPLYRNDLNKAEQKIRAAMQMVPADPMLIGCEALLWAKRGERRKAEQTVQRALRGKSFLHTHHTMHLAAGAYAIIGKTSEAVALLAKATQTGLPNYSLFRDDPHFQSLATERSFIQLLRSLKVEWNRYRREFSRG